jgi:hypothetical protein
MPDADLFPTAPVTIPPPLSEAYQKAHKEYGLSSALLIAWELVGFNVQKAPLENIEIELKNPEAIPWVLIVLVVYFGFRITIEWKQCDETRRRSKPPLIDFLVSHGIGATSIGLFSYQRLSQTQLATVISDANQVLIPNALLGSLVGLFIGILLNRLREKHRERNGLSRGRRLSGFRISLFGGVIAFAAMVTAVKLTFHWGVLIGISLSLATLVCTVGAIADWRSDRRSTAS